MNLVNYKRKNKKIVLFLNIVGIFLHETRETQHSQTVGAVAPKVAVIICFAVKLAVRTVFRHADFATLSVLHDLSHDRFVAFL